MGLLHFLFGSSKKETRRYCDCCGALLNDQPGFDPDAFEWTCQECGYITDVDGSNILEDEDWDELDDD